MARWGAVRTWITSLAIGCNGATAMDGDGATSATSTGTGDPQSTTTAGPTSGGVDDGSGDSSGSSTSEDTSSDGSTTDEPVTSDDESTSGGPVECPQPPDAFVFMMADEGTVEAPMQLAPSLVLPMMPSYARSYVAEQGTIRFELDFPCGDAVIVRALVWDRYPGLTPEHADSLSVSLDDGPEVNWTYGCATAMQPPSVWAWLPVTASDEEACSATPVVFDIEGGKHSLTFRNREGGVGDDFAGLVGFVITNDANLDPLDLYQPYP